MLRETHDNRFAFGNKFTQIFLVLDGAPITVINLSILDARGPYSLTSIRRKPQNRGWTRTILKRTLPLWA